MTTSLRRAGRAGLASTAATVLLLAGLAAPARAGGLPMVLSGTSGPSGGGNSITGTVSATTNNPSPFAAGSVPMVQFQFVGTGATACGTGAKPVTQIAGTGTSTTAGVLTVNPDDVKRTSSTKIAITVPSSSYPATVDGDVSSVNTTGLVLVGNQVSAKWNICVYDVSGTTLLAQAAYILAPRPRITSIVPASSPVFGGQMITVNGSGFSTVAKATTATVGGVAMTNLKVSSTGTSLTATTPSRAAGTDLALIVTTPGGPVSSLDPDNNGLPQDGSDDTNDVPIPFTYSNGISVSPISGQLGSRADVSIRGVGFSTLSFNISGTGTPTDGKAHIFLVQGAYTPSVNRGFAECGKVMVVSDTELACTLDLSAKQLSLTDSSATDMPLVEGTYTITVVGNSAADAVTPNPTIISSGSTFTVAPY